MNHARFLGAVQRALGRGPVAMALAAGRTGLSAAYRLFGRRYVVRRIHGYRMTLDLHDAGLSRALMLFRTREVDHKIMLERIVRPGMRIFDIGGNIGYYPLMELSLMAGSGELIVVEPVPDNVALLQRNLELNGHAGIPVLEAAISNAASRKDFHLSEQSNLGTFHPSGNGSERLTGTTLEVETLTIPILAQRYGAPDLLRMDIEGHEVEAIGAMLDDIARGAYAPAIIFETHQDRYGPEHDMAEILRRLFALGYGVPLLSASDRASQKLIQFGYKPGPRIATDAIYRTLFSDVRPDDAIEMICHSGGVRTVLLARPSAGHA